MTGAENYVGETKGSQKWDFERLGNVLSNSRDCV